MCRCESLRPTLREPFGLLFRTTSLGRALLLYHHVTEDEEQCIRLADCYRGEGPEAF